MATTSLYTNYSLWFNVLVLGLQEWLGFNLPVIEVVLKPS